MTAFYIIGGVLLALLLLTVIFMITPIGVRIKYDKEFSLYVCVAFIKVRLLPGRDKKIRVRKYSRKYLERQEKKRLKRLDKNDKKKQKKKKAPEKKKPKKEKPKKKTVLESMLTDVDTAPEMILRLIEILQIFAEKYAKRMHITVFTLDATIGSDDAAKTAIIYGGACAAAGWIATFLDTYMDLKKRNKASVRVSADFLAEKPLVSADAAIFVKYGGIFTLFFELRKEIIEIIKLLQEDDSNG